MMGCGTYLYSVEIMWFGFFISLIYCRVIGIICIIPLHSPPFLFCLAALLCFLFCFLLGYRWQ